MLIVENSQDLFLKTGDSNQNNIFSDLNRFNNDVNAYNYNNSNMYDNKKKLSPTYTMEKKESKFEGIKNNYFSDSYLLFQFKDEVSKNGFRRFENILLSKSIKKAVYINTALTFLLLYSIFIVSHYTKIDEDYYPYLSIKTAIILLLIIFVFLTDKLVDSFPKTKFFLLTITYLFISINNMYFNEELNVFNLINMTVEEIVILTAIESCGIFNYLEMSKYIFTYDNIYSRYNY